MVLGCPGLTDGFYVPRSSTINQDRPLFDGTIFPVPLEWSSRNTPLRERQAWWISVHQVHSSTNAHNSRRGCRPQAPTKPIANNLQKSPTSPRSRGAWRGGNNTSPVIVRMNPHARRDLAILRVNNGHRLSGKFSGEIRREYMCQTCHALPFIYSAPSQSSPYRCAELNWCVHHPNQW